MADGGAAQGGVRLAFFLPHFAAGGIEKVVLNLLREIDRSVFQPTLVLATRDGPLLADIPESVAVHDLGGRPMRAIAPHLARLLRHLRVDVVYSGTNAANLALLAAAALLRRPPGVIVSEHTPMSLFFAEAKWPRLRRLAMRMLYRRADAIAVPYAPLGDDLRRSLGARNLPVREVLNPVVADAHATARPVEPDGWPGGEVLVAAGRLERVKGFDILLDAFARLAAERPELRLVVLGEGSERGALEAQARAAGVGERVLLPGHVADPQAWFAHAGALVVASRREGTPNVVVEAMAAGAPVVAADCSDAIHWLLQGGEAGLLVEPENPAAMAAGLSALLADPGRACGLRSAGRARARAFTYEATLPGFERLFLEMGRQPP
jgi:glycosyltransferase involved in cell wall biosynthesis